MIFWSSLSSATTTPTACSGSVDKCVEFADSLKKIGVDEIGCLVDFGIDDKTVLAHLPLLNEVRAASNADGEDILSVSQSIVQNGVTHLQCTPSRASMVLYEPEAGAALANLNCMMVGGEPLSGELVEGLREHTSAPIFNMYGPTETTIWSTVCAINEPEDAKSIGTPLVNQAVHVLDPRGVPVPPDVVGELAIARPRRDQRISRPSGTQPGAVCRDCRCKRTDDGSLQDRRSGSPDAGWQA